jgi:hypothetical protein
MWPLKAQSDEPPQRSCCVRVCLIVEFPIGERYRVGEIELSIASGALASGGDCLQLTNALREVLAWSRQDEYSTVMEDFRTSAWG